MKIINIILFLFLISSNIFSQTKTLETNKIKNKTDITRKDNQSNQDSSLLNKINSIETELKQLKIQYDYNKIIFDEKSDIKSLYTWQISYIAILVVLVTIALPIVSQINKTNKLKKLKNDIKNTKDEMKDLSIKVIAYNAYVDYIFERDSTGKTDSVKEINKYIHAIYNVLSINDKKDRNSLLTRLLIYLTDEIKQIMQFSQYFEKSTLINFKRDLLKIKNIPDFSDNIDEINQAISIIDDCINSCKE